MKGCPTVPSGRTWETGWCHKLRPEPCAGPVVSLGDISHSYLRNITLKNPFDRSRPAICVQKRMTIVNGYWTELNGIDTNRVGQ